MVAAQGTTIREYDDEPALISRAQGGDGEAVSEILIRHRGRVQRLAHSIVRNPMDAEEVVQDVMMTIANKIDRFRGDANLTTWIHRIAVNAALMQRRRDRSAAVVSLEAGSSHDDDGRGVPLPATSAAVCAVAAQDPPVDRTVRQEFWAVIWDAVGELDAKYRSVFVMRDVDGLSTEETAQALGLKIPAVKSRLHRARRRLKSHLAWYFEDSGRARFALAA